MERRQHSKKELEECGLFPAVRLGTDIGDVIQHHFCGVDKRGTRKNPLRSKEGGQKCPCGRESEDNPVCLGF